MLSDIDPITLAGDSPACAQTVVDMIASVNGSFALLQAILDGVLGVQGAASG